MPVYTSDALILRTYKLGEADRIVVFLTRDRGKKRGVAKGARRAKSRFAGALESLTRAGVAYYERELRDLVRINYIEPQRSPLAIVARHAENASALGHAEYFAELIDEWAPEGHADERLYRLGSSVIDAFADGAADRPAGALLRVLAAAAAGRLSAAVGVPRVRRAVRRRSDDAGARAAVRLPALRVRRRDGDLARRAAVPAQRRGGQPGRAARDPARARARAGSSKPPTGG